MTTLGKFRLVLLLIAGWYLFREDVYYYIFRVDEITQGSDKVDQRLLDDPSLATRLGKTAEQSISESKQGVALIASVARELGSAYLPPYGIPFIFVLFFIVSFQLKDPQEIFYGRVLVAVIFAWVLISAIRIYLKLPRFNNSTELRLWLLAVDMMVLSVGVWYFIIDFVKTSQADPIAAELGKTPRNLSQEIEDELNRIKREK